MMYTSLQVQIVVKTFEQLGPVIFDLVKGIWQCNGNEYWERNRQVSKKDFRMRI